MNLTSWLNKYRVISLWRDVQLRDLEKWQNNLLLFCQCSFFELKTSNDIMDYEEERQKHTDKKVLRFISSNIIPQWKKKKNPTYIFCTVLVISGDYADFS